MYQILSEEFGLYGLKLHQHEEGDFGWSITYLDDDGSTFGSESDGVSYAYAFDALKAAMIRLAELFQSDGALDETKPPTNEGEMSILAGKGTRTPDILLGKKSVAVKPSELEVQS